MELWWNGYTANITIWVDIQTYYQRIAHMSETASFTQAHQAPHQIWDQTPSRRLGTWRELLSSCDFLTLLLSILRYKVFTQTHQALHRTWEQTQPMCPRIWWRWGKGSCPIACRWHRRRRWWEDSRQQWGGRQAGRLYYIQDRWRHPGPQRSPRYPRPFWSLQHGNIMKANSCY